MTEPPPRCHIHVTADCYGECGACPFGVRPGAEPEPAPEPLPLSRFARVLETARRIGYAALLVLILAVLLWHVITR